MEGALRNDGKLSAAQGRSAPGAEKVFPLGRLPQIREYSELEALISEYFGPPSDSLEAMCRQIKLESWYWKEIVDIGNDLCKSRGDSLIKDRFIAELVWGLAAYCLVMAVLRGSQLERGGSRTQGLFARLKNQMFSQGVDALERDLQTSIAQDRSAVLTSVHPVRPWIKHAVKFGSRESIFIRKLAETNDSKNGVHYISTSTSTRGIVLKAVKLLQSKPMSLIIYPDGPFGGDRATRAVGPYSLDVGLGASAVAWFSSSDLYFVHPTWNDRGPSLRAVKGPACEAFGELEDYNAAFADFYASEIENLIFGDPKNIVGFTGMWQSFKGRSPAARKHSIEGSL